MFSLDGAVILVTGSSRGIGRSIALELGRAGASVVLHGRTKSAAADEATRATREVAPAATCVFGDVSEPIEVERFVSEAVAWRGRLDGLVTSAGIYRGESLEETDASTWRAVLGSDLDGTFHAIRAAAPALRRSGRGAVVTVSSVLGSHAAAGGSAYQAGKAAIEQLTRAMALELAPSVRVNAVAPGFIRTDMNRGGHEDPTYAARVRSATPLGRWGESEDVAPAVRFLLSHDADWITGTVLPVDGGIALR